MYVNIDDDEYLVHREDRVTARTTIEITPVGEASACGTPVDPPLDRAAAERQAALLKAVADPVRLQLLSLIRASDRSEACVCDLTPGVRLAQPTVSHHLKVLTDAGLLTREKRGTWAWFRLVPERLDDIAALFR